MKTTPSVSFAVVEPAAHGDAPPPQPSASSTPNAKRSRGRLDRSRTSVANTLFNSIPYLNDSAAMEKELRDRRPHLSVLDRDTVAFYLLGPRRYVALARLVSHPATIAVSYVFVLAAVVVIMFVLIGYVDSVYLYAYVPMIFGPLYIACFTSRTLSLVVLRRGKTWFSILVMTATAAATMYIFKFDPPKCIVLGLAYQIVICSLFIDGWVYSVQKYKVPLVVLIFIGIFVVLILIVLGFVVDMQDYLVVLQAYNGVSYVFSLQKLVVDVIFALLLLYFDVLWNTRPSANHIGRIFRISLRNVSFFTDPFFYVQVAYSSPFVQRLFKTKKILSLSVDRCSFLRL